MKGLEPGVEVAQRFTLARRLGAGGLAEVWVARDRETGAEVALKFLHAHLASDGALVERFKRELAVTRELQHPGIVRVFDLHEHLGRPFFSMELLAGQSLAERLRAGPLAQEEARRIARELALSLQCAHRAGVVHRDLKPGNVLLLEDGRVKLLDFGLARAAGWSRQTAQSTVLGTPGYIAPELLTGKGVDARADLYSLGATLFEMLTGKRAFPGVDAFATLRAKKEAPPSPRAVDPRLDAGLDAVVRRALESDVERRFLDAGQVVRALDGEQLPAAPVVPMALTAGDCDVLLHLGSGRLLPGGLKAVERVLARLGAPAPSVGWSGRLRFKAKQVLVAGVNRAQAEGVVALCQSEGVASRVVGAKKPGLVRRWGQRNAGWLGAVAGSGVMLGPGVLFGWGRTNSPAWAGHDFLGALVAAMILAPPLAFHSTSFWLLVRLTLDGPPLSAHTEAEHVERTSRLQAWLRAAAVAALTALGAVASDAALRRDFVQGSAVSLSWVVAGGAVLGAMLSAFWTNTAWARKRLPRGDPAVRRLGEGIAGRVQRLRARLRAAPRASRMLLEGLEEEAERTGREALRLSDLAAETLDPTSIAQALPLTPRGGAAPGALDQRDRALDGLLEIAAALDDVLAGLPAKLRQPAEARTAAGLESALASARKRGRSPWAR